MTTQARTVVRIADMAVLRGTFGELVTHALGSCIGLSIFDPVARIAGLLHFMLPAPGRQSEANLGAHAYASTAVPQLFRAAYALGADKERLIICAAGGAQMIAGGGKDRIGNRNRTMLRKLLWKNNLKIAAEDTGGNSSRTLTIHLDGGTVRISSEGASSILWAPRGVN